MAKGARQQTWIYRSSLFSPEDILHFVEEEDFGSDWKNLGLNDEEDLSALQVMIMANPRGAPIVRETGGLRKMRFAPDSWNSGKSGAARVCYAYFEKHWTVLLLMAYGKGAKENLSNSECLAIKKYLRTVEKYLDSRNY